MVLGNTHCRTLDHCDLSIAKHIYILVCLSLNKTLFYCTAIIELASGVHVRSSCQFTKLSNEQFSGVLAQAKEHDFGVKNLSLKLCEPSF